MLIKWSLLFVVLTISIFSCANTPLPWPQSPLYNFAVLEKDADYPLSKEDFLAKVPGNYAHYDVVAYEDISSKTPMRTFIISYGYSRIIRRGEDLYQQDIFLAASYRLNQKNVETSISQKAVQAIQAREQKLEYSFIDGFWHLYRPESPVLLGIQGDPELPLSRERKDPKIIDSDQDGKPGITVNINIAKFIKGEIYITRREIYRNHLVLYPDGRLIGWVEDFSEQFVVDANLAILRQASNNIQVADKGLNPLLLIPVDDSWDSLQDLLNNRDSLFPPEPKFW